MKKYLTISLIALFILTTLSALGTWLIESREVSADSARPESDSYVKVCYNANTGKTYGTIEGAIADAEQGQSIYTYPGNEYTLNESITLTNGVSLYLPYDDSKSIDGQMNSAGGAIDSSATNVNNNRKFLLNLRNGADIIVESGSGLYLGGMYGTKGCYGSYCEINLGRESSITVVGTFQCYGYVKENNDDAVNPYKTNAEIYDNSNDSGRYIEVTSTGKLESYMALQDAMTGGGLATAIQGGKVCPFWTYDFPAMQTYTKYIVGCQFNVNALLNVATNWVTGTASVIGESNASNTLFRLTSGYVGMEYYRTDTTNVSFTSASNSRTGITIFGEVTLGSIRIEAQGYPVDSSKFYLPISYKEFVRVCDSAILHVNSQVKFLTESYLQIDENAIVEVNSDAIFYTTQAVELSGTTHTTHTSEDATVVNNGTIIVGKNGSIGGYISHAREEGNASIDLTNAGANALSVSAVDDSAGNTVTVKTTAPFLASDDEPEWGVISGDLVAGETYASGYYTDSVETDIYFWVGPHTANATVSVHVVETDFKYAMSAYKLYVNSSASTNRQETNESGSSMDFEVQVGYYIRIEAPDVEGVTVIVNGTEQVYNSSTWMQVLTGAEITIVPSEGTLVAMYATGLDNRVYYRNDANTGFTYKTDTNVDLGTDGTDSGRGSTKVAIYASSSASGSFTEVASGTAGDCWAIIKKGSYFRVRVTSAGTNSSLQTIEFSGKYSYWVDGEYAVYDGFDPTSSSAYQTAGHTFHAEGDGIALTFGFHAPSSCIVEGTLIMLPDGTQKPVEDVKPGDKILIFNHETGKYEAGILWYNAHLEEAERAWHTIVRLQFSDSTEIGISYRHAFFDLDLNKYVYIDAENYTEFIGHRFSNVTYVNGEFVSGAITLVSVTVQQEFVRVYEPLSEYHLNMVNAGLLSMPSFAGGIDGLINIFEYDKNMKYDEEKMQADIEMYGLFTYEDWAAYASEEDFNKTPAKYFKVALAKGLLTMEDIYDIIMYLYDFGIIS